MWSMIEENFKIDGVITKPPKNLSHEDYIGIFNYSKVLLLNVHFL